MIASVARTYAQRRRHEVVLAAIQLDPRCYEAHTWLQRNFDDAPSAVQSVYLDLVIRSIRRDAVPLWRQLDWNRWLSTRSLTTTQCTDLFVAQRTLRSAHWLRRALACARLGSSHR